MKEGDMRDNGQGWTKGVTQMEGGGLRAEKSNKEKKIDCEERGRGGT